MGFGGGMYHDQVVLEDGVWKFWSVVDRRTLLLVADLRRRLVVGEGSRAGRAPAGRRRNRPRYPPDIPLTKLGERERGFRGGTGDDDRLARHPADVVPLQEPRQRTRPRALLAGLRPVHAVPRDQHEEPRLPAAAVVDGRQSVAGPLSRSMTAQVWEAADGSTWR